MGFVHKENGRYLNLTHVDIYTGDVIFHEYRSKAKFEESRTDGNFHVWEKAHPFKRGELKLANIAQIVEQICPEFYKKLSAAIYDHYDGNLDDHTGMKGVWDKDV